MRDGVREREGKREGRGIAPPSICARHAPWAGPGRIRITAVPPRPHPSTGPGAVGGTGGGKGREGERERGERKEGSGRGRGKENGKGWTVSGNNQVIPQLKENVRPGKRMPAPDVQLYDHMSHSSSSISRFALSKNQTLPASSSHAESRSRSQLIS